MDTQTKERPAQTNSRQTKELKSQPIERYTTLRKNQERSWAARPKKELATT